MIVEYRNFLSSEQADELKSLVAQNENNFIDSSTATRAEDYRKSKVWYHRYQPLLSKVNNVLPDVFSKLEISEPENISSIESQITWHGDGCFYKTHIDNGSPEVKDRVLTYVYYFHNRPKLFFGGQLKLKDETWVEPQDNTIVFFDSSIPHEVLPVYTSADFKHGRFTINGWINK